MARENFAAPIRRLIAERAGHQCSFPTCTRRTVGPAASTQATSSSGVAAHIFAASPGGPRGQGGLSADELAQPENGIWLCGDHGKIIDNNTGTDYAPETLLSYKALQEARVALEHEGLYAPIGWLHEVTIVRSPIFAPEQTIRLSKLNLLYGDNESGKTAITEWIDGFFNFEALQRWLLPDTAPVEVRLSYLNPRVQRLGLTVSNARVHYAIDGRDVAFVPMGLRVLRPKRLLFTDDDDLQMLSRVLNLAPPLVQNLLAEVNRFPHANVSNMRFEADEDGTFVLRSDVHGTVPGLSLRSLSGREVERVVLGLVTAAARLCGRHCPTLLILDETPTMFFEGFFDFYSHHLLDPQNQFQTILCIPGHELDLDAVRWKGWEVIRTDGKRPRVRLSQTPRVRTA